MKHDIFIQAKLIQHGAKAVMEQVIFILKIAVKRRTGNQRGIADVGQCELLKGRGLQAGKREHPSKRVGAAGGNTGFSGMWTVP